MLKNVEKCWLTLGKLKLRFLQLLLARTACFTKVKSYKLLGVWLDVYLKWTTNTAHITKKAVKRLYLLKVLKSYNVPAEV